jgi:hypothetical protein
VHPFTFGIIVGLTVACSIEYVVGSMSTINRILTYIFSGTILIFVNLPDMFNEDNIISKHISRQQNPNKIEEE